MFRNCADIMHKPRWQEIVICTACQAPVVENAMKGIYQSASAKVNYLQTQLANVQRLVENGRKCSYCTKSDIDTYCQNCINDMAEGKIKINLIISQKDIDPPVKGNLNEVK